jgi:hypothetical protein
MKTTLTLTVWLLAILLHSSAAFAGDAATAHPQVILQAWQVKRVDEAGAASAAKETLAPLQKIRPGDVVEYEARYVNGAAKASQGVQLTLPVPAGGLQYLPVVVGATPEQTASLDGVRYEPVPLRRAVRQADGRLVMRDVPVSEYRFLRWNLGDVPAGAERAVRARMQLPALVASGS